MTEMARKANKLPLYLSVRYRQGLSGYTAGSQWDMTCDALEAHSSGALPLIMRASLYQAHSSLQIELTVLISSLVRGVKTPWADTP